MIVKLFWIFARIIICMEVKGKLSLDVETNPFLWEGEGIFYFYLIFVAESKKVIDTTRINLKGWLYVEHDLMSLVISFREYTWMII